MSRNRHGLIMSGNSATAIVILVLWTFVLNGTAFAHGTEKHGQTTMGIAQMKKMHAMMPIFSATTARMKVALTKGDAAAVAADADMIVAALPDLKVSKPHKNSNQRKRFAELADRLGTAVTSTADLAKKGDFAGAKDKFRKVEEACVACHAIFRD